MVAQKEDVPEGPYIQSMPSEGIRNQLISMARALHQSVVRIEPKEKKVRGVKGQLPNTCSHYKLIFLLQNVLSLRKDLKEMFVKYMYCIIWVYLSKC